VTYKEIEEMIRTVDRNGDGRISYSEFRLARARLLSEHKANNKKSGKQVISSII
jgi:Ca2+-binding EF-hand superfamily protein